MIRGAINIVIVIFKSGVGVVPLHVSTLGGRNLMSMSWCLFCVVLLCIPVCVEGVVEGSIIGRVPENQGMVRSAVSQRDTIAVLIATELYTQIQSRFDRYIEEVEDRFPVTLSLHRLTRTKWYAPVSWCGSMTPEAIREVLQQAYAAHGITGALLVGQLPFAVWEQAVGENTGVSSIFYEDLDGTFEDRDGDGYLDYHGFGPQEGPEIWVCWMRPPVVDQVGYLTRFLDKTHAYYTGSLLVPSRALVACHEDYDNNFYGPLGVVPVLEELYGSANVDRFGGGADVTVASELWEQLETVGYEICDTWQHASATYQAWDIGGFSSYEVLQLTKGSLMTFLYGCHSADFWEAPGTTPFNVNLAVSYVFGESLGQAASGTSWSYGTEYKYLVYEALRDPQTYLGEAWYRMESYVETASFVEARYPDRNPCTECAGNNLIGNPFLSCGGTACDLNLCSEL